jgi:hypothetical protein
MSKTFNDSLTRILKNDPRFIDDNGDLIKAAGVGDVRDIWTFE